MAKSDLPTNVSPFLDRPGLDPAAQPEPALHLLAGIWIASCPTCGFQLATARTHTAMRTTGRRPGLPYLPGGRRRMTIGRDQLLAAVQPAVTTGRGSTA
jgi:hypothetical protein